MLYHTSKQMSEAIQDLNIRIEAIKLQWYIKVQSVDFLSTTSSKETLNYEEK